VIQEIAEANYVMKSRRPGENYLVLRGLLLRKPVDEANEDANDEIHMPFIVTPDWEKSVADITHC
jgi:hypothetical protein